MGKDSSILPPRSERGWVTFAEYNKDSLEDLFYEGNHIKCKKCGTVRVYGGEMIKKNWAWCDTCKKTYNVLKFEKV